MNYIIKSKNGNLSSYSPDIERTDSKLKVSISKELFTADIEYIDLCPDFLTSKAMEHGYMIAPRGTKEGGTILSEFKERADCEYISDSNTMPIFGWKDNDKTILAIVTGMTYEYKIVLGVKNNCYYLFPRFYVNNKINYEDIVVEYNYLPVGSDYNDMAAFYKSTKHLTPLRERVKNNKELLYAVDSPELRIRLCWKPVPAKILHQTPENEPPITIGCTLDRAKDILQALKTAGVDKLEVCLVGMEVKGHDGRWPQLLPIEEEIGGQAKLEELCRFGQDLGYQMVTHTNSTEMYEISNDWNPDELIQNQDGTLGTDPIAWGGGQPFFLCPKQTVKYTKRNLQSLKSMGFRGIHYIDVLTNFPPRNCFNPLHPITARQSAEIIKELAKYTRDNFGGFASEGGFDYAAENLDYALYTAYNLLGEQHKICDELIPFWQLVYHGTILYNPSAETVNYSIKSPMHRLKFIEHGGRPIAYINSKYVDDGGCGNWMGEIDMLCGDDEQLTETVNSIKSMYEEYKNLCDLQLEHMLRHDKIDDGIYRVTYSNGTTITVDYNKLSYKVEKYEQ